MHDAPESLPPPPAVRGPFCTAAGADLLPAWCIETVPAAASAPPGLFPRHASCVGSTSWRFPWQRPHDEMRAADGGIRDHYLPLRWLDPDAGGDHPPRAGRRTWPSPRHHLRGPRRGGRLRAPDPRDIVPRIIPPDEWARMPPGSNSGSRRSTPSSTTSITARRSSGRDAFPTPGRCSNSVPAQRDGGHRPAGRNLSYIAGIDLVRAGRARYYVLEDNLRTPSGVSTCWRTGKMMMRLFPELFAQYKVAPVDHYPDCC